MRLTVLGSGAACAPAGGNSSGYLVEDRGQQVLLDCGHGVGAALLAHTSPDALDHIFISHMHFDHFIDLIPLRFAANKDLAGLPELRTHLHLPPGGREVLASLLVATCFPPDFFDNTWKVSEYRPGDACQLGPRETGICAHVAEGVHYIPGWAVRLDGSASLTYTGDTAPARGVCELARGSDLLLAEATLDEPEHGPVKGISPPCRRPNWRSRPMSAASC